MPFDSTHVSSKDIKQWREVLQILIGFNSIANSLYDCFMVLCFYQPIVLQEMWDIYFYMTDLPVCDHLMFGSFITIRSK